MLQGEFSQHRTKRQENMHPIDCGRQIPKEALELGNYLVWNTDSQTL